MKTYRNPLNVFLSYDQKDERILQALETHLGILKQQGLISAWHRWQAVPSFHDKVGEVFCSRREPMRLAHSVHQPSK